MLKVYAMNVAGIDVSDSSILDQMSTGRLKKLERLRAPKVKKQSIGAELLLNYALGTETGAKIPVEWETDENGKLFVPGSSVHVNLSHSGDYAVCALSDGQVGVDIERVSRANLAIAKRFFTQEEYEYIQNSDSAGEVFCDIWVKKESFTKAVGRGLAIPLCDFSVLDETICYEGKEYSFQSFSLRDRNYRISACFEDIHMGGIFFEEV